MFYYVFCGEFFCILLDSLHGNLLNLCPIVFGILNAMGFANTNIFFPVVVADFKKHGSPQCNVISNYQYYTTKRRFCQ